ncbi:MAG: ABC transporter ATP-binding protein [Flavobacteriales bacterium]|nr:ABC transporter ATP-binding protein [Flavobacteriales bacterium]
MARTANSGFIEMIKQFKILESLKHYPKELSSKGKSQLFISAVVALFLGLTEGIGLMMIIPLLELTNIESGASDNQIVKAVQEFFTFFNIEMSILSLLSLYILIISFYAGLKYYKNIINVNVIQYFTHDLRTSIFKSLSYTDWLFFTQRSMADLTTPILTHVNQVSAGITKLLQIGATLIISFTYVFISSLISIPLTLLAIISIGALGLLHLSLNKKTLNIGISDEGHLKKFQHVVLEHVQGIKTAKSYGAEVAQNIQFSDISNRLILNNINAAKISSKGESILMIGGALVLSIFYFIAFNYVELDTAHILLMIVIFSRLIPKASSILKMYQSLLRFLPAFETCLELRSEARAETSKPVIEDYKPLQIKESIQFKSIHFEYKQNVPVLNDLNMSIPVGKTVAISGASGAVKLP